MITHDLQTIAATGKVLPALKRGMQPACPVVLWGGYERGVASLDGVRLRNGWAIGRKPEPQMGRATGNELGKGSNSHSDNPYRHSESSVYEAQFTGAMILNRYSVSFKNGRSNVPVPARRREIAMEGNPS